MVGQQSLGFSHAGYLAVALFLVVLQICHKMTEISCRYTMLRPHHIL